MDFERAIELAIDGQAILFLGAGFSLGATNLKGDPFRTGKEFACSLAEWCELPKETSLEDAVEEFSETRGKDALIHELKQEFTASEITDFHRGFARIPWKRIYTTNYDNVIECAYHRESKELTPITLSSNMYDMGKTHPICVHLNGFIEKLDRKTLDEELKLTESSYLTASLENSPWMMLFRQDLRLARAVFFVGYSLEDLDIKRVLFEAADLRDKSFFVLGQNPTASTIRRARRFGTVLEQSTGELAEQFAQKSLSHRPAEKLFLPLSLVEHHPVTVQKRIDDQDFLNLVLLGEREPERIMTSLTQGEYYYLNRSAMRELFKLVDSGHTVIAVCSDLGNGKSLFVEGLRYQALEKGYRVFEVAERTEEVVAELEQSALLPEKVLVVIEEYQNWLDEIRLFRMRASDQDVLVVTARNAIHDVLIDALCDAAGADIVPELRLDVLLDEEINWLVEAFDQYGLWGTRAGLSQDAKARFIRRDCNSQYHAILLKLLKSPDIGQRFQALYEELRKNPKYLHVVAAILILTVLNCAPTLDLLADLCGASLLSATSFKQDPLVRQLVDFDGGKFRVRSAVAAQYLLRKVIAPNQTLEVLIQIAENASHYAQLSDRYRQLFIHLMRFSSLQLVLPEKGRREAVIRYYEAFKILPGAKRNILFWLQYAIASLVVGDLYRSEKYFETTYSLARKREWNTFQIDNHYARFLLVSAVERDYSDKTMLNFRQARNIINRQIKNERRHYAYRVAITYEKFLDTFEEVLSLDEVRTVGRAASHVLDRIQLLPKFRRNHRYVRECQATMEYVCARVEEICPSVASGN